MLQKLTCLLAVVLISTAALWAEDKKNDSQAPPPSEKTNPQTIEEEISFENKQNKDKISGVFVRPAGAGPFPVIIYVMGGGSGAPGDRRTMRPIANLFLKLGFAALLWDKPGVGKSTGNFRDELADERLSETQASLKFILARNDIDQKRVGMYGVSGAGEMVPQIAASGDIAFAIMVSPVLHLRETLAYAVLPENILRQEKVFAPFLGLAGLSKSDLDEGAAFVTSYVRLLEKENVRYDEILALLKERDGKPWFQKLCKIGLSKGSATDWTPEYFKRYHDLYLHWDSRPFLAQTRCPILVILGAEDSSVDPVANAKSCAEAGLKTGAGVITVKTLAHANHVMDGSGSFDLMCAWLKDRCPGVGTNAP